MHTDDYVLYCFCNYRHAEMAEAMVKVDLDYLQCEGSRNK